MEQEDIPEDEEQEPESALSDDDDQYYGGDDYAEMPMEKHSDLLRQLTDFDPHVQQMFYDWLAVEYNEDEKTTIPLKGIKPMMNEQGCRAALTILRTYLRGNNIITQLDQANYNAIMMDCGEYIATTMGVNDELYGIKSDSDYYMIFNQLYHSIQLVLLGAGGTNTYKDLLKGTVSHQERGSDGGYYAPGMPMPHGQGQPPRQGFTKRIYNRFFG